MGNTRTGSTVMRDPSAVAAPTASLLREVARDVRQNRIALCQEWLRRIREARLLTALTRKQICVELAFVYDHYVQALEGGSVAALDAYAPNLSERFAPRGVETHEVTGVVLLLRDVLARFLFPKYRADFALIDRILPKKIELTLPPLGVVILRPSEPAPPSV